MNPKQVKRALSKNGEHNHFKKRNGLRKHETQPKKEGIINLTVTNEEERQKLWDKWKNKHPNSKKTWRTNRKQGPNTLRCQAPIIIKRVSATVKVEPANSERSESIGFNNEDINPSDTDSIHSDEYGWANSGDTESIQSEASDFDGLRTLGRANSINSGLNEAIGQSEISMPQENIETHRPLLSSSNPTDRGNQETNRVVISKIYIDDETLAQWSKENLMAYTFPIEPFPVRAPSETNRYEVRRFYEFLPEEMRKIKKEEK